MDYNLAVTFRGRYEEPLSSSLGSTQPYTERYLENG